MAVTSPANMKVDQVELKTLLDKLIIKYRKPNVSFDGGNQIKVLGPTPRPARVDILKAIAGVCNSIKGASGEYRPGQNNQPGETRFTSQKSIIKIIVKPGLGKPTVAEMRPADIKPSIVNEWMSPNQMVKNVLTYLKNYDGLGDTFKARIAKLLTDTENGSTLTVQFAHDDKIGDKIEPEFFEILTAIKIAVLLRKNDLTMRKILGIPNERDLRKAKIKVFIPSKSNTPLLDYELSISENDSKPDEHPIRISVKSSFEGGSSNSVKFPDVFDSTREVDQWYKALPQSMRLTQGGPRETAYTAMETKEKFAGKLFLFPLRTVNNLIGNKPVVDVILRRFIAPVKGLKDIKFLKIVLTETYKHFGLLTPATLLSSAPIKLSAEVQKELQLFLNGNLGKQGAAVKANFTAGNLGAVCEKILIQCARPDSETKHNYYPMFYDQVLRKRRIAYAVAHIHGTTIRYGFYSMVNFEKEYNYWVALRTKNYMNVTSETLGMDVKAKTG